MTSYITEIRPPDLWSENYVEMFAKLVEEAGEVQGTPDQIKRRAMGAKGLAMLHDSSSVTGTAALKIPLTSYRRKTFRKAGKTDLWDQYEFELGWVVVSPELRRQGRSTDLIRCVFDLADNAPMFATARTDNDSMCYILAKLKFAECGSPYPSTETPGKFLQLYVKG